MSSTQVVGGTVISAVIGGTVSSLTGGKFANGAKTAAMQYLFNQVYNSLAKRKERRGPATPRPEAQRRALFNTLFSSIGAGVSTWGCVTSGTTCGLAAVLAADAYRQFKIGIYGTDPVIELSRTFDLTREQATSVALATDIVTATVSINGAYKGLLSLSGKSFTSGSAGVIASDVVSSANTLDQLSDIDNGN